MFKMYSSSNKEPSSILPFTRPLLRAFLKKNFDKYEASRHSALSACYCSKSPLRVCSTGNVLDINSRNCLTSSNFSKGNCTTLRQILAYYHRFCSYALSVFLSKSLSFENGVMLFSLGPTLFFTVYTSRFRGIVSLFDFTCGPLHYLPHFDAPSIVFKSDNISYGTRCIFDVHSNFAKNMGVILVSEYSMSI